MGKRIFDLNPKLSAGITDDWEFEIDITGETESSKIKVSELAKKIVIEDNMPANTIKANANATTEIAQNIALAINQVLGRTSGNIEALDLQEQIIVPGTIASADWSTGQATYTGIQGQWTVDTAYKYDCIGTDTWIRTPIMENRIELYLADIDDSAGDKTSSELDIAYPTAEIGQRVYGTTRNLYEKRATNVWFAIPHNITTDTTYIPERLDDITGLADNDTITVKAQYDIQSIRIVAETTTPGNISIGSADGLSDIVISTALPTTIGEGLRLNYIIDNSFPTLASRVLYVNIDSVATVTSQIVLQKIY